MGGDGASKALVTTLGLGWYLGWQLIDISPTLFAEPLCGVRDVITLWSYVGTALLIASLIGLGAFSRRTGTLLAHRWIVGCAMGCTCAGTVLLYICGWLVPGPALMPGVALGRVLFFASAGFVACWGEVLCRMRGSWLFACVAGGYSVAFGACLITTFLEPVAAMFFRVTLPFLSGICLLILRADIPEVEAKAASCVPMSSTHISFNVFVGIGVLGGIFTVANHLSETKTDVSTELYTLVAGIATSLALLIAGILIRGKKDNFPFLYRLITPLVIGCLLLTLVLQPGYQRYEALAIGSAWAFYRVFTWTLWGHVGRHEASGGAAAFAFGQVVLTACGTLGELLSVAVDLSSVSLPLMAAAIIFVTVITSALIMNEGSVARLASSEDVSKTEAVDIEPFRLDAVKLEDVRRAVEKSGLSDRECEIALLVLQGKDNASICAQACITESTLRTHLRNIYSKVDVHSRLDLASLLEREVRAGWSEANCHTCAAGAAVC